MATRRTDMANALRNELARYPVRFAFGNGGKHGFVRITSADGRERRLTMPCTPSCSRANENMRRSLRRLMAEMKIEPRREDA